MELDIKEMLELGKKAAIIRNSNSSNVIEAEVTSTGSRYVCTVGDTYRLYNEKPSHATSHSLCITLLS